MGFIITRNHTYIRVKEDGKKYYNSDEKEKATEFASLEEVRTFMDVMTAGKRKTYCIVDVDSGKKYVFKDDVIVVKNRNNYGNATREYLYDKAEDKCELCGRKIPLPEMTIDHVVPLAMGGRDEIANLQCACQICNRVKDKLMPEEYADWVKESFEYQIRKRSRKSLRWMIAAWAVKGI